jgi:hypothetical protein
VKSAREWAEPLYRRKPTPWGTDVVEVTAYVADIERAIRAAQIDALREAERVCRERAAYGDRVHAIPSTTCSEAMRCADAIAARIEEVERVG